MSNRNYILVIMHKKWKIIMEYYVQNSGIMILSVNDYINCTLIFLHKKLKK